MLREEHRPWPEVRKKLNATRIIFSACGAISVLRFAKERRSRHSHTSGHLRHCVFNPAFVVKKKSHRSTDDVDNGKTKACEQLLVAHALRKATRKGITDSTDATGKTKVVFFFSKHLGLCRFAETRVDSNRCVAQNEIAQEKGPGDLVRPQSTRTQCPSMRERDVPRTMRRIREDFSLAVTNPVPKGTDSRSDEAGTTTTMGTECTAIASPFVISTMVQRSEDAASVSVFDRAVLSCPWHLVLSFPGHTQCWWRGGSGGRVIHGTSPGFCPFRFLRMTLVTLF